MLQETTRPDGAQNVGNGVLPTSRLVLDLHTDLGESIIWDDRTEFLYFVDINGKKIYGCKADGTELFSIQANEMVGTIALTTDPNLLLAAMNRYVIIHDSLDAPRRPQTAGTKFFLLNLERSRADFTVWVTCERVNIPS